MKIINKYYEYFFISIIKRISICYTLFKVSILYLRLRLLELGGKFAVFCCGEEKRNLLIHKEHIICLNQITTHKK